MKAELTHEALTRRTLLTGGAGALGLAVLGATGLKSAQDPYSLTAWEALPGTVFDADHGARLHLDGVETPRPGKDCFALRFSCVKGEFPDGLITVQHPSAGPVPLFMTGTATAATAYIDGRRA